MVKITVLAENRVRKAGLLAEHGLSIYLETDETSILFDTGQSDVFLKNAQRLGIDVNKADSVVISHGHYDHGGGVPALARMGSKPAVYVHSEAFRPKFAVNQNQPMFIGLPWTADELRAQEADIVLTGKQTRLSDKISLVAQIQATQDFEQPASNLKAGPKDALSVDLMRDEQVLVCQLEQGLLVLLGCSHPGVVSCLEQVRQAYPGQAIQAVVGGMHLSQAGNERLDRTIEYFKKLEVRTLVPFHCTGQDSYCRMKAALGDLVLSLQTGDQLNIN